MLESDCAAMPERGDDDARVRAAASRLEQAMSSGRPCRPVRDLLGDDDIPTAYRVQNLITRARTASGVRVIGRKIGLTSPAVQKQLGVDQPDFGTLFSDMRCEEHEPVPMHRLLQPRVEAEVAFVLGADLDTGDLDPAQVRGAVDYAVAALEIVDSRVAGWDITITDTIADNASSGLFVLGARRVRLDAFEPADVTMTLAEDGVVVSEGVGRACLGDPLIALSWLARTTRDLGEPLRAGELVLSGALGPMVTVRPGTVIEADISVLGKVSAKFPERGRS